MALGTQAQGKLLDYEQFIDHQLARTQAKIKTTDILIACLTLATAFLGVLFLEIVLDHAVGLPIWARRVILWLGTAAAAELHGVPDRPALAPAGQRLLRGQDDRGDRPRVQE